MSIQYEGDLFGRVRKRTFIKLSLTSEDVDRIEAENKALRDAGESMASILRISREAPTEEWASEEEIDLALARWDEVKGGAE